MKKIFCLISLLVLAATAFADGELQFAHIGNLTLQTGAILKNCEVGYRTFGKMDSKKDNVVLFPTWYLGKSADLAGSIGPGKLLNSDKYYVIAVDALTNGVSTSPSNSQSQSDAKFPEVTIRDMVESQHRMLLQIGITHLKAVMGISMGGIQTFTWVTAYPNFMDDAIPIVGSPRPSSYDLMLYSSCLKAIKEAENHPSVKDGFIRAFADFFYLALETPTYFVSAVNSQDAIGSMKGFEMNLLQWDPYDMSAGMEALIHSDAFQPFGDSELRAASGVKAKMLIINASQDHCVNPAPTLNFAKLLHAKTIVLHGDSGHSSPGEAVGMLSKAISRFLSN